MDKRGSCVCNSNPCIFSCWPITRCVIANIVQLIIWRVYRSFQSSLYRFEIRIALTCLLFCRWIIGVFLGWRRWIISIFFGWCRWIIACFVVLCLCWLNIRILSSRLFAIVMQISFDLNRFARFWQTFLSYYIIICITIIFSVVSWVYCGFNYGFAWRVRVYIVVSWRWPRSCINITISLCIAVCFCWNSCIFAVVSWWYESIRYCRWIMRFFIACT